MSHDRETAKRTFVIAMAGVLPFLAAHAARSSFMSKSQNRTYQGATYSGNIDTSPTTALNTLPTVKVQSSGLLSLPSGTACVNIIGSFDVVLTSASFVTNQTVLIVATGGVPAKVSLDNGGTVAGITGKYLLTPGDFLAVSFDGTNLNLISHTGFQS
jgi:hypothetical protein